MASVQLDRVRKVYDNGQVAVQGASFEVADGELMVLVGPSGCGKSTLLRMIAGLEDISGGTLSIGDRVVNDVAPKDRDIAMVFQSYALYPHMTVAENLAFGLKLRKHDKATAWPWGVHWCASHRCSCWMSRFPTLTPSCAIQCARKSRACIVSWAPP